jgi:hypothetical protein
MKRRNLERAARLALDLAGEIARSVARRGDPDRCVPASLSKSCCADNGEPGEFGASGRIPAFSAASFIAGSYAPLLELCLVSALFPCLPTPAIPTPVGSRRIGAPRAA